MGGISGVQTLKNPFLEHRGLLLSLASRVELHELLQSKLLSLELELELCDLEHH
jgi:hypothetical protein